MAGNIFWKEQSVTSFSGGVQPSIANAVSASTDAALDNTSTGPLAQMFSAVFELTVKWTGATTGIVAGTNVADLYLVPAVDRTNFPDVSSSSISPNHYVASFIATKVPTVSTNVRFATAAIDILPMFYQPWLINQSGQTISSSWTLKATVAEVQYT